MDVWFRSVKLGDARIVVALEGVVTSGRWAVMAALMLLSAGCSGGKRPASVPATFTPPPSASAVRRPDAPPARPVVGSTCLRGLSSYRFSGSFALKPVAAGAAATPPTGEAGALAGSLANLLGSVSFQGSALAPDRYQAQVNFGGNGVQGLEIVRIGAQTFSRFGNSGWQKGGEIEGLDGIAQFDPENLCERGLTGLDASGQTPARENVNGVASLRYEIAGPQVGRSLSGGGPAARTPTPGATAAQGIATVWVAESGGYPVRFQLSARAAGRSFELQVNISDINGRDIQIDPPA